jgi:hypothetical protein
MKMRRRIAQAQDYADYDAIITAEICDRRNGAEDRVARQQFLRARLPVRVKSGKARLEHLLSAYRPKADLNLHVNEMQ